MNLFWRLLTLPILLLPFSVEAAETVRPVEVRAVLHDPLHPQASFQMRVGTGSFARLELVAEGLSAPTKVLVSQNSLSLYDSSPAVGKDAPPVLATVSVLSSVERAILIIVPMPAGSKLPYGMVILDDSPRSFPFGESRVVNLTDGLMGMQVGRQKIALAAGKVTTVPEVKDINEYNMAQTNFYSKSGEDWIAFTERQLQYLSSMRRVFLVHVTPGALVPSVTTVIDYQPVENPK